jgi:hypothetical protein
MVIRLGALEVAHLVHQGLEPVVHGLWLLSLVEDEPTELPSIVSRLVILVTSSPSCADFSMSQISLALFNPYTLLYSSRHREARSIVVAWESKCFNLGDFVRIVAFIPHRWYLRSKLNNIPYASVE